MASRSKRTRPIPSHTAATGPFALAGSVLRTLPGKIAAGLLLTGALSTLLWQQEESHSEEQAAQSMAEELLDAATEWKKSSSTGCPSVSRLIEDQLWDSENAAQDPWGNRYRISCRKQTLKVRSAGQDRRFSTPDDISISRVWNS